MTIRQAYEAVLVESDKVQAPTILIDDFNYLFNKAISLYISKMFPNRIDARQEDVDKIMTLVSTVTLDTDGDSFAYLPDDYLHLLNCFCTFTGVGSGKKCENGNGELVGVPARHLNPSRAQEIRVNAYFKPCAKRPYYIFKYENEGKMNSANNKDVDINNRYKVDNYMDNTGSNFRRTIDVFDINDNPWNPSVSVVERDIAIRYGRPTRAKIVIDHGNEGKLNSITVDYVKAPQFVKLTKEQMDLVEDTSQILEWDDLVCYELIDSVVLLIKSSLNINNNVK